jgi:hypothetical protein
LLVTRGDPKSAKFAYLGLEVRSNHFVNDFVLALFRCIGGFLKNASGFELNFPATLCADRISLLYELGFGNGLGRASAIVIAAS